MTDNKTGLSTEKIGALYRAVLRIRRVEEEVARIYPTDLVKSPIHLSIGQEAVSVGVCDVLEREDIAYGTYRGHALYLAKGGDLKAMIAELFGRESGCAGGKAGSMHLVDSAVNVMGMSAIVATNIPLAVGHAFAIRSKGQPAVVVCFFGEGATDEGAFHEAMNFASLKYLPLLFVCENNQLAIHSPAENRMAGPGLGGFRRMAFRAGRLAMRILFQSAAPRLNWSVTYAPVPAHAFSNAQPAAGASMSAQPRIGTPVIVTLRKSKRALAKIRCVFSAIC